MQLDVPAVTKRTASGTMRPYLMGMNIHLSGIIVVTVLLFIDKGGFWDVQYNAMFCLEVILRELHHKYQHYHCH